MKRLEEHWKLIITPCKRSLRRLCFHRCLSVHGGGVCGREACIMGGVHAPSGRYYEIWSMSGRYASYWNAFLLLFSNLKKVGDNFSYKLENDKF